MRKKCIVLIGNSYSRVEGLTTDQFRKLKKVLSYTTDPKAAYFSGGWSRTKYMIDAKGNFPTGLINYVTSFCDKEHIKFDMWNECVKPLSTNKLVLHSDVVPHKWQSDVLTCLLTSNRGGIVAPTGTGKSLAIALLVAKLSVKTLVVVPNIEIKNQLKAYFNDHFEDTSMITVENIDSSRLETMTDFDCLIIDECHHVAAKTYQNLNKKAWKNIYYRFFFTATFFRNQSNEQLLFEGIAGTVIYRLTYKEAIKQKYIVPVEAYYIDCPKKLIKDVYKYADVYKELIVHNSPRNSTIAMLLLRLGSSGISTLCLVKEIRHGALLEMMTGEPFVNGQDEESRRYIKEFNNGTQKILVGTTGILGEGVDTKPCEYVIIAGSGKAKSAFLQQIGRGVRNYPGKTSCKVILFRDTSHKFMLRHFKEQCKILKDELNIIPMKLELD